MPPIKHTGFLAYLGGEATFWVVLAVAGGAASCVAAEKYGLASILAGVAGAVVFFKIFRAGERAKGEPGLFYCERCQYYFHPSRIQEQAGAI